MREDVGTHLEVALHECTALWWTIRQSLSQLVDLDVDPGDFFGAPVDRVNFLADERYPAESVSRAGDVIEKASGPDGTILCCRCKRLVVLVRVHREREGGTSAGLRLRLAGGLDGELHHVRGSNLELLACVESFVEQIGEAGATAVDPYMGNASGDEGEELFELHFTIREFGRYVGN